MAMNVSINRNYNIGRVVKRVVYTVIWLWVGGDIINIVGDVMNGTCSPFYKGLTLIGWTVSDTVTADCTGGSNTVTATNGDGILAVVGVLAMASVVLEFINIGK